MARTQLEKFFESLEAGEGQPVVEETQQEVQPVSEPSTGEQPQQEAQVQQPLQQEQPLVAGKFKSVDDLVGAYQELERKFYEIQEKLKRAEQGLEAFSRTQPSLPQQPVQPTATPEAFDIDVDPLVDPKGFAKKVYEKVSSSVIQQVQNQIMLQRQMDEVRERFYKLNPDLVGKERLVGLVAQDVAREMPNASLDVVLDEIAKRTRQFLHSLTQQQKQVQQTTPPASPTPQQSVTREKITPPPAQPLTPEQEIEAYIRQRKEFLSKKKL